MIKIGKRGKDHTWQLVRYNGDVAIYAKCKCGYRYACSREEEDDDGYCREKASLFYSYCPHCGARKKWVTEETKRINKYPWE